MGDVRDTLHVGQVSANNVDAASARVGFDDLSESVSAHAQVVFPACGHWNLYYTPRVGDHVLMSRLQNGIEEGHILGKVYTAGKLPQNGAEGILSIVSDDGKNVIRLDAINGTMDVFIDQGGTLKWKTLDMETAETSKVTVGTSSETEIGTNADIKVGQHLGVKADDTDINSNKPVGLTGGGVQLGSGNLRKYWGDERAAWAAAVFTPTAAALATALNLLRTQIMDMDAKADAINRQVLK